MLPENFGVPLEGDRDVGALCGSHQEIGRAQRLNSSHRCTSRMLLRSRRGSEEVLPENFGVPLEGDRDVGALCGSHQG